VEWYDETGDAPNKLFERVENIFGNTTTYTPETGSARSLRGTLRQDFRHRVVDVDEHVGTIDTENVFEVRRINGQLADFPRSTDPAKATYGRISLNGQVSEVVGVSGGQSFTYLHL